ncbi:allantoicase [Marinicella litoralis]|uniref:Probable allantoicase n=1 Tax=Marinicella litoralis TaxID=644220 RepID=A0A4R6XRW6_9GAMM|nr:allantoicase [Marinicella litoralis]TDR20667.1 allantoicase [Marinicella litoralis]
MKDFTQLIDLAAERVGGFVLDTSDDFFAEKENLIKPGRGIFIEDKYTDRGKWMDGWESRRKRTAGHDWCTLKLGLRGVIHGVDIDTNHFLGNHPPHASLEAACVQHSPLETDWHEILPKSPLAPGSQNLYPIESDQEWTHLRLHIYPDGGVARLKVYGEVKPDWTLVADNQIIDLVAVENGGRVICCNDMFFSSKDNLIMPGRGINMGDGWETKRRRGPGHDWSILKLGHAGFIEQVEVDTHHFKGNFPDRFSLESVFAPDAKDDDLEHLKWQLLIPETKLTAHQQHHFDQQLRHHDRVSHVRFNIFPDGGVSRLRLNGTIKAKKTK